MIKLQQQDIVSSEFSIPSAGEELLFGRIHALANNEPKPIVCILHGFKGFMDWGFFPHTAQYIARAGAIAIPFNMSLCGVRPGEDTFADEQNFFKNTISREVADTETLLAAIVHKTLPDSMNLLSSWDGRVFLLGHSRGGGVALLTAAKSEAVHAAITWAAVSKFMRFSKRQIAEWKQNGQLPVVNTRTKQTLYMAKDYIEDIEQQGDALKPTVAVSKTKKPLLLLHGAVDMTVPVAELHTLAGAQKHGNVTAKVIEKTNHTFHCEHPFKGETIPLKTILQLTMKFVLQGSV